MGIIYIAQNQTYGPNVYKVGKTERTNVRERMQEITGATGVLGEFNELGRALVNDVDDCERKCHEVLRQFRIQQNREFFRIDMERLVPLIRNTISEKRSTSMLCFCFTDILLLLRSLTSWPKA